MFVDDFQELPLFANIVPEFSVLNVDCSQFAHSWFVMPGLTGHLAW